MYDPINSKAYIEKWGGFNSAPPNWKKVTTKEIVQKTHFSSHQPEHVEYRQILGTDKSKYTETQLYFYYDGTGIGISTDYWKGKIQCFRFGCDHEYKELTQKECSNRHLYHAGKCYHVSECLKCGHLNSVDSSD